MSELPALIERLREDFPVTPGLAFAAADALRSADAEIASLRSLLAVAEGALSEAADVIDNHVPREAMGIATDEHDGSAAWPYRDEYLHRLGQTLTAIRAAKEKTT